jgi:hypothetical protein
MADRLKGIAYENKKLYGVPPSWDIIESFIKEVGISKYHFELYYGIPFNHLAKVKTGAVKLGKTYWHIFYERIKLPYGVGFKVVYEALYKIEKLPNSIPKRIPKDRSTLPSLRPERLVQL